MDGTGEREGGTGGKTLKRWGEDDGSRKGRVGVCKSKMQRGK